MEPFLKFRKTVLFQLDELQTEIASKYEGNVSDLKRREERREVPTKNADKCDKVTDTRQVDATQTRKLEPKKCPELTEKALDKSSIDDDGAPFDEADDADAGPPMGKMMSLPFDEVESNGSQRGGMPTDLKRQPSGSLTISDPGAPSSTGNSGSAGPSGRRRSARQEAKKHAMWNKLPEKMQGLTIEQALQKGLSQKTGSPYMSENPDHKPLGEGGLFGHLGSLNAYTRQRRGSNAHENTTKKRTSASSTSSDIGELGEAARNVAMKQLSDDQLGEAGCASVSFALDPSMSEYPDGKPKLKRQGSGPLLKQADLLIRRGRGEYADKVFSFLEVHDSSKYSQFYGLVMNATIIFSVCLTLAQSIKPPLVDPYYPAVVQACFEVLFLIEMCVRFAVLPDRGMFFTTIHNYIDLINVLPLVLRATHSFELEEDDDQNFIVRFLIACVPIVRMLKLLRRFQKFLLLQHAFRNVAEALPVLGYTMSTMALTFACLIYLVEPRHNIESLPEALWLTIVTMTTVGYGDEIPVSGPGFGLVSMLIISSALYMAMPIGIVGAAFNSAWMQRDCILLVKRARDQMVQLGYTAIDIPCLFKLFDSDKDGELSRGDFVRMIESMNIHIPTERVIQLFDTFDSDGGGSIDAIEFIRHVFPKAYAELYGHGEADEESNVDEGEGSEELGSEPGWLTG